jgi:hypothetical protein
MSSAKSLIAAAIVMGLTACAGQPKSTSAPDPVQGAPPPMAPSDESAPQTLAEAEAALERARSELLAVVPGVPLAAAAPSMDRAVPESAPAEREEDASSAGGAEVPKAQRSEGYAEHKRDAAPCETACKAFVSLQRARDAVCRLEEPRGPRCERAEGIVRDAEGRMPSCVCPG